MCKLAFVDDFKPTQDLSGAVLRQISGGNNLTAARKFKGENVFKFHGMLMICANGLWRSDKEWKGADRRLTGLPFQVEFVDQPHGPNQSKKDSSVKDFPEFWFLMRVLWLSTKPFPRGDHIEPRHSRRRTC